MDEVGSHKVTTYYQSTQETRLHLMKVYLMAHSPLLPPALHHHSKRCPLCNRSCIERQFLKYQPDLLQHNEGNHNGLPALPPVHPPLGPGGSMGLWLGLGVVQAGQLLFSFVVLAIRSRTKRYIVCLTPCFLSIYILVQFVRRFLQIVRFFGKTPLQK